MLTDLLGLHARAVRAGVEVVSHVDAAALTRRTPCEGWNLGRLLSHMTAQHHGFAAAAHGHGADLARWRELPLGDDPAATYANAAEVVLAAFAEPDVLERTFTVPDFGPGAEVTGTGAITAHFVDYVVHAWDVARGIGLPFAPEPDIAEATLSVARRVPDDAARLEPGAAFRPALEVPDDASPFEHALLLFGRRPDWS